MSTLSIRNHPYPSLVWERIREEVRIFFSLSAPINRTRFWLYWIGWTAIPFAVFRFIFIHSNGTMVGNIIDNLDHQSFYFLFGEVILNLSVTIGLFISSIKRLRSLKKPIWVGWVGTILLFFLPFSFNFYTQTGDYLHIFTNRTIYAVAFIYTYGVSLLGLLFFILYLGFSPINWKRMYQYFTKHSAKTS